MITVERCKIENRTLLHSVDEPAMERIRGGGGDEDSKMEVDPSVDTGKRALHALIFPLT